MAVQLDPLEIEMLQQLAIGKALGEASSRVAHVSRRMFDLGFVEYGPDGQLQPTEVGRQWLVQRNQGESM